VYLPQLCLAFDTVSASVHLSLRQTTHFLILLAMLYYRGFPDPVFPALQHALKQYATEEKLFVA